MFTSFLVSHCPRCCGMWGLACCLACHGAVADESAAEHAHGLEEVTVTATPLERTVEQLAQPSAVLAGEELVQKQSTSIGETLSQELGVSSTYFGPIASRPVIRGQSGERVRVLEDGLDSLDVSALSEDHQVGLEGIVAERIEVIRGPATLLYGSGAAGGLVNLVDERIIEQPLSKPVGGTVALGGDSALDERAGAVRLDLGTDRVGVHFDYFARETSNVEIPGFAESALLRELEESEGGDEEEEEEAFGTIENSDSETDGGALSASLLGESGFIGVSLSTFNSEYGVPGHHEEGEEEGQEAEEEEVVRIDLEQTRIDLKGAYDFDGVVEQAKLRIARSDYEHTELEGSEIGTFFDTQGLDARLELQHRTLGNWQGAFGVQFKDVDFEAIGDEAFLPPSETTQTSVFAFEELAVGENFVLQLSGRLEHQSLDAAFFAQSYSESAVGAAAGGLWRLTDEIGLALNLSRSERHPTTAELFADGPHLAVNRFERGSVVLGDGVLDKETSTNFDVTLRGRTERIDWAVTGFLNDVDDYISLNPTTEEEEGLQVFEYMQTDAEFYGVEAEGRVELMDNGAGHLHASLFSDFVHAEENGDGPYLPRLPPLRFGAGLEYTGEKLSAGVHAVFHAEQNKTAPDELPTDEYMLLSANIAYHLHENGLYLFLRGTNLTDEDARQHTSPLKDTVPLPGRSIHAGLRYDF